MIFFYATKSTTADEKRTKSRVENSGKENDKKAVVFFVV